MAEGEEGIVFLTFFILISIKMIWKKIMFWLGILTAAWFAFLGFFWTFNAALIIAYPIGLISLVIWLILRKDHRSRNKVIIAILLTGLVISLTALLTIK